MKTNDLPIQFNQRLSVQHLNIQLLYFIKG